jgi:hypothetical protein
MTDFLYNLWSQEEGQDIAEYAVMCWLSFWCWWWGRSD